ncbi:hypothetical protein RI570_06605 [Brucella pseudogrignonensis]|uniref:hypothetical protein n=1 Tax=Brucella pseudogrignonensis TaxID=419475 RepID=UPI0028B6A21F|nr:hypothetical protein [Brucella pseudogrignonensis]MDT6939814.1 hypothetical protein [Brucella pseudogrignonensis]
MTLVENQMIEIQPINSHPDIPAEIWVAMGIQLVLMALIFWLIGKGLSKLSAYVVRLVHGSKADTANSSEGGAQ